MKKISVLFLAFLMTITAVAQEREEEKEEKEKGFKAENLFTGGSVTLSFFNRQTILGANPIFGYKITDWLDAGLAFNYVYASARDYSGYNYGDKLRQTVWGPGAFVRLYPVKFLFIQGQLEHNFINQKYFPPGSGSTMKFKEEANSLLLGAGLAQGRERGSTTFYYISLLFDVLKNENSPYVDVTQNPSTFEKRVDILPIIRAGINIGLFQGRYRR
jgi:hypothetical protein